MPETAPSIGHVSFTVASGTDPGRVRSGNEDRLHVDAERGIFAMVDGVGGHAAGEVAAAIAVDVIARRLERPLWTPDRRVREAIVLANNEILTQAQGSVDRAGMTCVLTLALLTEHGLTIGHVGDTRLYKLTSSNIVKLTHDHSPIGEREDSGEITEAEAMRHPRRNEVFRDVGSAFHEPDDPDFVEVIRTSFDETAALLLCTDGLSDMLTGSAIERLIRTHAGSPDRVVEALIQAANEAGGKDNVSVIYVEGRRFAAVSGGDVAGATAPEPATTTSARPSRANRTTWLAIGLVLGLAGGMGLTWALEQIAPVPTTAARRLVVGATLPEAPDTFASIAAAMEAATAGDTLIVEPGEYAEAVILKDGVDLSARVPGAVTLVAPPARPGWIGLTADGRLGNHITGLRIRGTTDAPMAVGVRLAGHGLRMDDVDLTGSMDVGIDVVRDGSITVQASRVTDVTGLALRIGPESRPVLRQNVFVRKTSASAALSEIAADAAPEITGNVFDGYASVVADAARNRRLLEQNYPVAATRRAP